MNNDEFPTDADLANADELALRAIGRRSPEDMDAEELAWRKEWAKALKGRKR